MKKLTIALTIFVLFIVIGTTSVSAAELDNRNAFSKHRMNTDAQKVLDNYDNGTVSIGKPNSKLILPAAGGGKRVTFKRGSWAAWSHGIVDWTYTGSRVTYSEGDQDSGWVFPNIVREKGITKMGTSTSSTHKYRHKTTIGAGTPTPWGDVKVYEQSFTDYINVRGNGTHYVD